jgi:radical SAM protein with 4Fe4S-binding SPASM domain
MNLVETPELALPAFVQIEPVGEARIGCRLSPVNLWQNARRDAPPARPPALIGFDAFCRLLDQFPALQELQLQGAEEPLRHPRLFDMVGYAAGRGVEVSLHTSLTGLSARRAEECVASGLRRLHVALGPAGPGRKPVLRSLSLLVAAKKAAGSRWPTVHLVHEHGVRHSAGGPCDWPRRAAHISCFGEATPCRRVGAGERAAFGNMMKEGVVRVWNNDAYRSFRERLAMDEPPETCRGCEVPRAAHSASPAVSPAFSASGR